MGGVYHIGDVIEWKTVGDPSIGEVVEIRAVDDRPMLRVLDDAGVRWWVRPREVLRRLRAPASNSPDDVIAFLTAH